MAFHDVGLKYLQIENIIQIKTPGILLQYELQSKHELDCLCDYQGTFDQEKNYNQEPFVDPQQKNRAPGPASRLRQPELSRFDGHQPLGNHQPNQGL